MHFLRFGTLDECRPGRDLRLGRRFLRRGVVSIAGNQQATAQGQAEDSKQRRTISHGQSLNRGEWGIYHMHAVKKGSAGGVTARP
jgi:hypothetical protein